MTINVWSSKIFKSHLPIWGLPARHRGTPSSLDGLWGEIPKMDDFGGSLIYWKAPIESNWQVSKSKKDPNLVTSTSFQVLQKSKSNVRSSTTIYHPDRTVERSNHWALQALEVDENLPGGLQGSRSCGGTATGCESQCVRGLGWVTRRPETPGGVGWWRPFFLREKHGDFDDFMILMGIGSGFP